MNLFNLYKHFSNEERGATILEYALIVGLIAIVSIAAITAFQGQLGTLLTTITTGVTNANTTVGG